MPDLATTTAHALIRMAHTACRDKRCGCTATAGSRFRGLRCGECPLDDLDAVADHLANPISSKD